MSKGLHYWIFLALAWCLLLSPNQLSATGFSAGDILGFDAQDPSNAFGSVYRIDPNSGVADELVSLIDLNINFGTDLEFLDVLGPNRLLLAGGGPNFFPVRDVEEFFEFNVRTNTLTRLSRFQEATDNATFPFPPPILLDPLGVGVRVLVEPNGKLLLQNDLTDEELLRFDVNSASLEFVRQNGPVGQSEIVALTGSGRFVGKRFTEALFEVSGEEFGVGDRLLSTTADFNPDVVRQFGENSVAIYDELGRDFFAFDIDTLGKTLLGSFDPTSQRNERVEDFVVLDDGDILFASHAFGPALGRIEAGTDQVTYLSGSDSFPRFYELFVAPSIPEPNGLLLASVGLAGILLQARRPAR